MPETLDELEQRVFARFLETTTGGWELPDEPWFNDWSTLLKPPTEQGQTIEITTVGQPLQFPQQRWIRFPNRRYVVLLICDRALDLWDALTPEQRAQFAFLIEHGGRERVL